jgi:N-acetyl-anhydromuramyl-L-alanine amidase AmpD
MFPAGELRAVVLHWTAGDYETTYPAYHFCLTGATDVLVHATHALPANMRDVRAASDRAYAAHVAGRNSYTAGIAICAMRGATPADFAAHPVTGAQIDALCTVAAQIVARYGIAVTNVRTHAEVAVEDGYFGAGGEDERWDIARLEPSPVPLVAAEAARIGAVLRARIGERSA